MKKNSSPLLQLRKESLKKFRLVGFEPLTSAIPVSRSTNIGITSQLGAGRWKDKDEVMNIWKSYMRTAGWRIKWKRITGRQVYVIAKVSNYSWQKLISSLLYFDFQRYLRVTLINCMGFCFLPWIVLILTRFERALSLLVQVTSQRCHWPLKLMTSKAEQRWTGIGMGSRIG